MAKYLSFNGSGYLQLPSMTFTKITIDLQVPRMTDRNYTYFDARTGVPLGYMQAITSGVDTLGNYSIMPTYVNNVQQTNNTIMIPDNSRVILETRFTNTYTDDITIFAGNGGSAPVRGNLFDVKVWNGTILVAHYDMSTGTINDQTGNGYNATLTGGTWADNGVSPKAIVFDNFNRVDNATTLGNAVTGQAWFNKVGYESGTGNTTWGISSNQAYTASTTAQYGGQAFSLIDSGVTDCNISVTIPNQDNYYGGIAYRMVANSTNFANGYYVRIVKSANPTTLTVYSKNGGASTSMGSVTGLTISNGDVISVSISGNSHTIKYNGNAILTFTDSTYNGTWHGVTTYTSGTSVKYDNFLVTDLNTLVYDSFDRANNATSLGKADTGQTWISSANGIGISNNTLYQSVTGVNQFAYIDTGLSDGEISVKIVNLHSWERLVWRASDDSDQFRVEAGGSLYKMVKGVQTVLGSFTALKAGDTMKVNFNGNTHTIYANGVQVAQVTDSYNNTITKHGLSTDSTAGTLDNFTFSKVTTPPSPTTPPTPTIISVDHSVISDEVGFNASTIQFKFDTDVTAWSVNVNGSDQTTGTIADSGGAVTSGTTITAVVDWTELYQEGENKVNFYGQNSVGWTPHDSTGDIAINTNSPNQYGTYVLGNSIYGQGG